MADEAPASIEELQANLTEYNGQLKQIEELLLNDPENGDLSDMYNSLTEVIQLTEDLLKDALEQGAADVGTSGAEAAAGPSTSFMASGLPPVASSLLPASVAEQIRKAQVRAALMGQAPAAWAIGSRCQAMYSSDGKYYDATIEAVSAEGKFVVAFDGYEDKEELPLSLVRPMPETTEVYQGVAAPKRKRVEEAPVVTEIPKWLEVKDTDDEKTKLRKKKLLKSYKSKIRFSNMDMVTKGKQDNWQNFMTGKGTKKKAGFFTGRKKESIFKVPDGITGKVGVVGSGAGVTEFGKRLKNTPLETEDD